MIHVEEKVGLPDEDKPMRDYLAGCHTIKAKIECLIDIVKTAPIHGCITGSCFLPGFDPDLWGATPDVDVFVYTDYDLIRAIDWATMKMKMKPGTGTDRSEQQELWKISRLFKSGLNKKIGITTYKFYCDGVVLNFTYKMEREHGRWVAINDAPGVLRSFDMSIVLQAYDIESRVMFDLRPKDVPVTTAIPNPLRDQDCMMWTVSKWVRQFDRVVKYYSRGFDTRPVAKFYLDMIDQCIDAGCLFDSEESHDAFDQFSEEFVAKRAIIADWYDEHKED